MEEVIDRTFYLLSNDPGLVLDVEHRSRDPGSKVILFTRKDPPDNFNQIFYFDIINNTIRTCVNDFALDGIKAKDCKQINTHVCFK